MMLNQLCKDAHENAKAKGWWETEKSFGELIALCHSELSEALEEYRDGNKVDAIQTVCNLGRNINANWCYVPTCNKCEHYKPEGIPIELADTLIRIFDMCGHYGIDLDEAVRIKMEYNKTRSHRHGGKVL